MSDAPAPTFVDCTINGEARAVPVATTVLVLVEELGQGTRGIAVAVNREVVPRSTWASVPVAPGDDVEILIASQGG